jgi:hypothetical protein
MKRDLELIRNILLDVESCPPGQPITGFTYDGKEQPEILEHVVLLTNAEFIEGDVRLGANGAPHACCIRRLTWKGHEFLDSARDDVLWRKVLSQVKERTVSVSLEVLQSLLTKALKGQVGLE